jgi:hypothetical protein
VIYNSLLQRYRLQAHRTLVLLVLPHGLLLLGGTNRLGVAPVLLPSLPWCRWFLHLHRLSHPHFICQRTLLQSHVTFTRDLDQSPSLTPKCDIPSSVYAGTVAKIEGSERRFGFLLDARFRHRGSSRKPRDSSAHRHTRYTARHRRGTGL